MNKQQALASIENSRQALYDLSDKIWGYSETAFKEFESCKTLSSFMEEAGFKVERGLSVLPTSFKATFGSGKPVIGILGEYDALAGIGQVPEELRLCEPNGKPTSQACGHNLLGVGAIAAAMAVKSYLEDKPGQGTGIFPLAALITISISFSNSSNSMLYKGRTLVSTFCAAAGTQPNRRMAVRSHASRRLIDFIDVLLSF